MEKFLKWTRRKAFPSRESLVYSTLIGFALGYIVYTSFFQRHFFSWRYLTFTLFLSILFSFLARWLNSNILFARISQLDKHRRVFLIGFSILLAILFLINTPIQPVYYLLPDSDLQISFKIDAATAASKGVRLMWINTGQGFVHRSNMNITGDYEILDTTLIFSPGQKVEILWEGKAGSKSEIVFKTTAYDQDVEITWNGKTTHINLLGDAGADVTYTAETPIPLFFTLAFIFLYLISVSYLVMILAAALLKWKPKTSSQRQRKSYSWMAFMLPMLLIWIFSLLVFWPGVFTNDSYELWKQADSGNFNDWQSAFYAIVLYLLARIQYSLGFIMVLQVLFMSVIAAYGLGRFDKLGVPRPLLWIISILLAFSPLNNMQVITLWKDIPYAISFLWLTILLFEIFNSDGNWISRRKNAILILLVSLLISLLRQNGIPAAAGAFFALAIVYKKNRKQYLMLLVSLLTVFVLIKGPIYDLVGVDRGVSGQSNLILLHHIAAHKDAGTYFEDEELDYLDSLLPLEDWDYQCCYVVPIYLDYDFDKSKLLSNSAYNRKLAFELFLRDPMVNIRHMLCAGELAWQFGNNQCVIFSSHGFNTWSKGEQDWIIPNEFSLKEASIFPGVIQPYADVLRDFGFLDDYVAIFLRPALYFYLCIFSLAVAYIRNDDWKVFLVGIPLTIQTLLLLLINFSPVIRYFYSANLIGVLFIAVMFYQRKKTS